MFGVAVTRNSKAERRDFFCEEGDGTNEVINVFFFCQSSSVEERERGQVEFFFECQLFVFLCGEKMFEINRIGNDSAGSMKAMLFHLIEDTLGRGGDKVAAIVVPGNKV